MVSYDASEWSDLFVATAGAAAALAGLLFVAVSINLDRILSIRGLPERALQTLALLLLPLVVALVALIPEQSPQALGAEILVTVGVVGAALLRALRPSLPPAGSPRAWVIGRLAVLAAATVPFVVAGVSLVAEAGGGLHWAAAGIVFAIIGAVANAWVLLVEILR